MKLLNKFWIWSVVIFLGVLLLGTLSIWNLVSLRQSARASTAEYDAMDRAEATILRVAWLRDELRGANWQLYHQVVHFDPIDREVTEIIRELSLAMRLEDGDGAEGLAVARAAAEHLTSAKSQSSGATSSAAALSAANELEQVHQALASIAKMVPTSARHHIAGASDRLLTRLEWTCICLALVLLISALIHLLQYRTLVKPLLWLREDMKRSAAREYREEIRLRGDAEFRDVASLFNGLAREMALLYQSLEEKVIARSRELVRSERLASVGFLAAGVAHEINNPLSVVAGYAELAAKALRRVMNRDDASGNDQEIEAEAQDLSAALDAQGVIHDEAFRCKEITSRLLSLARGGTDERQSLHLDAVAKQVTVLTKGLRNYRDRSVVVEFDESQPLEIVGNLTEMKQVLLNLTVNALEAVPPQRGQVRIAGRREGDWVELSVEDNGRGMNPDTLQNVFEPFFTAKRGAGEPGTGLGLSITHAIIENHGGRIRAESKGVGQGSRFVVRLPARKYSNDELALGAPSMA
jgi:signal transduction histidine kinase